MSCSGPISFCSVPIPGVVYAGPRTRDEFDLIDLPETVHEWQSCETTTLIKGDGREWERRCTSKSAKANGVRVIFQWFDERPSERPA
ncbi:hypothetical protein [Coralloluteibacterium thermophilus]|uniref:Uncharacterized protein n=1 Tax=Coralloluteibacterium thermophilum TaxID=2707049 RepID=A0ABV9NMY2_9GAMM